MGWVGRIGSGIQRLRESGIGSGIRGLHAGIRGVQCRDPRDGCRHPTAKCRGQRVQCRDPRDGCRDPTAESVCAPSPHAAASLGFEANTPFLFGLGNLPGAESIGLFANEPANALSLPTWAIHFSSVFEWLFAMQVRPDTGCAEWRGVRSGGECGVAGSAGQVRGLGAAGESGGRGVCGESRGEG